MRPLPRSRSCSNTGNAPVYTGVSMKFVWQNRFKGPLYKDIVIEKMYFFAY